MKQTTKETAVTTPTARVTAARQAIRAARPRRLTNLLLWAAQIPLAAAFVLFGLTHLRGGGIYTVAGTAELAGAIGLLTPWLAGLAAAGRRRGARTRRTAARSQRPGRRRPRR